MTPIQFDRAGQPFVAIPRRISGAQLQARRLSLKHLALAELYADTPKAPVSRQVKRALKRKLDKAVVSSLKRDALKARRKGVRIAKSEAAA